MSIPSLLHFKRERLVKDGTASDSKCDTLSSESCGTDTIKKPICFTKEPDNKCNPWVTKGLNAVKVHSKSLGAVGSRNTVGCATTNDARTNECYNESGGILFIEYYLLRKVRL